MYYSTTNRYVLFSSLIIYLSILALLITFVPVKATEGSPFFLEGMDGELLLGQDAKPVWGEFWSAPTVSAINLGYLAVNGYPAFVPDSNGNGVVDRSDLIGLADTLGGPDYMNTDPDKGTSDSHLLRGLAKYVNKTYPDEFKIKIYETDFRREFREAVELPVEEIKSKFGVPIELYSDPGFDDYVTELSTGEMVWLGLPRDRGEFNHFLAGRSFDPAEKAPERYLVDFVEPKGSQFRPGWGRVIETLMTADGAVSYQGIFVASDILLALSPREIVAETTEGAEATTEECLPDLTCTVECGTEEVATLDVIQEGKENCSRTCVNRGQCRGWCYDKNQERYCCEGWNCLEWKTVCTETPAVKIQRPGSSICRVVTRNEGCSTATGMIMGAISYELDGTTKTKLFLNTDIGPGEEQVSLFPLEGTGYENPMCGVDLTKVVTESNEENNRGYEVSP